MPVYECYCPDCHTVFNFFSRRIDTETSPDCPRCGRLRLARQVSLFAIGKRRAGADGPEGEGGPAGGPDADLPPGIDESRLMRAFESMAGELDGLDDADPRQAARLMRRLYDATGLKLGDGMAEAIRRMESGEDPDAIEAELGDVLESEDPFGAAGVSNSPAERLRSLRRGLLPPAHDAQWYPLVQSADPQGPAGS